jgi:hypothetical protein
VKPADVWKSRVPRKQRSRVIEARLGIRRRLDPARPLPDFLIIGAQRSGTSSMYKWLESHPDVAASLRKETEYLSYKHHRGEAWYRSHFASRMRHAAHRVTGRTLVTFEASPYYLFHPLAPARAERLVPETRIVVLLRNPVDRAYSHWAHMRRYEQEPLSFDDAVAAEDARLEGEAERFSSDPRYTSQAHERWSYVSRGRYAEQLDRWLDRYPAERMLVLQSEALFADPAVGYDQVLAFLGLRTHRPRAFANAGSTLEDDSTMSAATRAHLQQRFAPHNERLARLLGRDFGWT